MSEKVGPSELDRVIFFSDAVFAIAITLLVVELDVPHVAPANLNHAMREIWPEVGAFFLTFAVIGIYWIAHHRTFRHLREVDSTLIVLNLAFLSLIAFQPFPAKMLNHYGHTEVAVVLYAASLCLTGVALAGCWAYAWHAKLVLVDDAHARRLLYRACAPAVVFGVSIPVALVSPLAAKLVWLGILVVNRVLPGEHPQDAFE